jgi:hypothetical protein
VQLAVSIDGEVNVRGVQLAVSIDGEVNVRGVQLAVSINGEMNVRVCTVVNLQLAVTVLICTWG